MPLSDTVSEPKAEEGSKKDAKVEEEGDLEMDGAALDDFFDAINDR